jgi:hypothetical protein
MAIRASRVTWCVLAVLTVHLPGGCSFGPHALERTRLPYNAAINRTTEEQLLLNIVRLRYNDTPSSLAVSAIATQFELQQNLSIVPFSPVRARTLTKVSRRYCPRPQFSTPTGPRSH